MPSSLKMELEISMARDREKSRSISTAQPGTKMPAHRAGRAGNTRQRHQDQNVPLAYHDLPRLSQRCRVM